MPSLRNASVPRKAVPEPLAPITTTAAVFQRAYRRHAAQRGKTGATCRHQCCVCGHRKPRRPVPPNRPVPLSRIPVWIPSALARFYPDWNDDQQRAGKAQRQQGRKAACLLDSPYVCAGAGFRRGSPTIIRTETDPSEGRPLSGKRLSRTLDISNLTRSDFQNLQPSARTAQLLVLRLWLARRRTVRSPGSIG
jgi:hypothetical protein